MACSVMARLQTTGTCRKSIAANASITNGTANISISDMATKTRQPTKWYTKRGKVEFGKWHGSVFQGAEGTSQWSVLRKLLSLHEAKQILKRMPPLEFFEAKPDSI